MSGTAGQDTSAYETRFLKLLTDFRSRQKKDVALEILYTITAFPPSIGGAQIHTHRLLIEVAKTHSINVISHWDTNRTDWLLGTTLRTPGKELHYELDGIHVRRLGFTHFEKTGLLPFVGFYYLFPGLCIPYLSRNIENHISCAVPIPNLIHNIRIGREPISYASLHFARKNKIPFVFTPLHHPRWSGWLYRYYHRLYREADAVIALTNAERETLIQLGVDEEKIFVTGIGPVVSEKADGESFRTLYNCGQDPIILFLGQKYPYKGFEALLKAAPEVWQKWKDARFVFLGPRTKRSAAVFKQVEDKRIIELGSVDLQLKTNALAASTILCVPSTQESFGGVYTEAWHFKKPVIGCDIPAVAEVISNHKDGLLVQQKPKGIAHAICQLLQSSTSASQMGLVGFEKLEKNFSWSKIAALTEKAYLSVLS
jgi:glycosyltransferase involved in cell wall biosynthesis